jgi:hypothetical protein
MEILVVTTWGAGNTEGSCLSNKELDILFGTPQEPEQKERHTWTPFPRQQTQRQQDCGPPAGRQEPNPQAMNP